MSEIGVRSRVAWAAPAASYWEGPGDPALIDLYDVSIRRGRVVFHGIAPELERILRTELRPYRHFVQSAVIRDRFDDVFEFSPEPLRWADCGRVEERSTFIGTPWHIDNAFHLHCDNLIAMFANLWLGGQLTHPRVLYLHEGDPVRNVRAVQLWSIMEALFDGAVRPFAELKQEDAPVGFRHIRWGVGPRVLYLQNVRATPFVDAGIAYQEWVLQHFGIPVRTSPRDDTVRPRVLMMARADRRRIANDTLLADALRASGLEVRLFGEWESTSAGELIRLTHDADILVGVHGAALAHMAYLPTGSLVAELREGPRHPVFEHMAPHFRHRHASIYFKAESSENGIHISPTSAGAMAQQILAEWSDRHRRRAITVRTIGTGNWGNELFWYMFGRTYAARHDLEFQVDPWSGNQLIGAIDPPVAQALPDVHERTLHDVRDTIIPHAPPLGDVNCTGYFQYHTAFYAPDRDRIREWFRPSPAIAARIEPSWQKLRERGRTAVAIHIRRRDYGFSYFYRTPLRWYLEQLERLWPTLDRPFLYIASDALEEVVDAFRQYDPVTSAELGPPLPEHDFYRDFYVLQHCDVLLIPNSTFSFAAAMLNAGLQQGYRSHLPARGFIPFDPWNSKPLDQRWVSRVESYPWMAELWRPTPAWKRWALWARGLAGRTLRALQRLYRRIRALDLHELVVRARQRLRMTTTSVIDQLTRR